MKFWERFSKTIFKLAAQPRLKKVRPKLIESVLAKSSVMLDPDMTAEIRSFIVSRQTDTGGFGDRGGKGDLYYSLFGFFIAEALGVREVMEPLKKYVASVVVPGKLSGVYRYCGAILYARLIGQDAITEKLRGEIKNDLLQARSKQPEYSGFLGILALYYLEDFLTIRQVLKSANVFTNGNHPCPVVAASAVMTGMAGMPATAAADKIKSFYRGKGGFAALQKAPAEDLLSTGVALYALHFLDADIRLIKPDCLAFVDDLYDNGGFRATTYDTYTDVEYTFYGLLALGSMC